MTKPIENQRRNDPFTIEAEYTLPNKDIQTKNQWTFEGTSPRQAKDLVLRNFIPLDATLWRIGAWFGSPEDRPDSGHEAGIFNEDSVE